MNDFTLKELQLITFLCFHRKSIVGGDECENEGTADLYRKTCAIIREIKDE